MYTSSDNPLHALHLFKIKKGHTQKSGEVERENAEKKTFKHCFSTSCIRLNSTSCIRLNPNYNLRTIYAYLVSAKFLFFS